MQARLFFFLCAVLMLYACRSTRKIQTAIVKKDTIVAAKMEPGFSKEDTIAFIKEYLRHISGNKIAFTTFSSRIDVEYRDADGKKYDVNAVVRMYKDSVIWISVTAILGIEGIRAYITRDSVKVLDKQNKIYTARSVSYLQEVTGLPLTLANLQDLVVGNPIFLDSTITSYTRTSGTVSILNTGNYFKTLLTVSEKDKNILSSKLDDIDILRNRTCFLSYSNYENKRGVSFSTVRTIHVSEKKKLDIRLNFKQYEFNETLSFPFSVPKNYTRN